MKRILLPLFLMLSLIQTALAQTDDLYLGFDFSQVNGSTITDNTGRGIQAKLMNEAKVEKMGTFHVLNLGNGTGYLDLTEEAGKLLAATDTFTISMYYFVEPAASLDGNGYFLWSFSTNSACTASAGKYNAYRLNAQRIAISTGGYGHETGYSNGVSAKGQWIHVAFAQGGNRGKLFINGKLVNTQTSYPINSVNFKGENLKYCWLGRAPFTGDSYLKNTRIADVKIFKHSLNILEARVLAAETDSLTKEMETGSVGDATILKTVIDSVSALPTAGLLPAAVEDLNDYISYAQTIANGDYSQYVMDEALNQLRTAAKSTAATAGLIFSTDNLATAYDTERGFKHPGGLYTQADFERIRQQIKTNDKVKQAWQTLKASPWASQTATTYPVETIIRGGSGQNYMNACRGAAIAFQNALRWKIEDNERCAANGVKCLMAWARTCKLVSGNSNWALAAGLYGYEFAQAAELLRDYPGWSEEDFNTFKKWMLTVWYPGNINFLRGRNGTWENSANKPAAGWGGAGNRPGHYWSNWPLCNALSCISIGILTDDVFIYNQGMSFLKYDQVGTFQDPRTANPILNDGCTEFWGNLIVTHQPSSLETGAYGELGQMQESGRDGGHAAMALGLAVDIAHVAWNQGDDLFSYMNNRLAAGIEFTAATTQNATGLPWTNYKYCDCRTAWHGGWLQTGYNGAAEIRPYWGEIIGHYEGVKGVKMPYAEKAYEQMGIDGGGIGTTSGGFDHLGFSVLLNTRDVQLAPADSVPTLLTPLMIYDNDSIAHNELGGLKNTYVWDKDKALPQGKTIRLIPQLPEGSADTGNWQWNTGATTREVTVTTDKSYVYRATYTNEHGVKSEQAFTIASQGDCNAVQGSGTISYDGKSYSNDSTIKVNYGETATLVINGNDGWGYYEWDNGTSTNTRMTAPVVRDRDYYGIYVNEGGARTLYTFHVKVANTTPTAITSPTVPTAKRAVDRKIYDLSGRPVSHMTHGVYIVNGEKVVKR